MKGFNSTLKQKKVSIRDKMKIKFQRLLLKEMKATPVDIVKGVKAEEGIVEPKVVESVIHLK